MRAARGKYEVFKVGDELVFSDNRIKIQQYAEEKGASHITYKMSSDNKESLKGMAKEIK